MQEAGETWARSLCREDPLEESMATHSGILAWRILWTRSLAGYSPQGRKESDTSGRDLAQHLGKYSAAEQQLAHGGWQRVSRQAKLLMEEGEKVGDGRAEGSSAKGDRGQSARSLTPDIYGTHVRNLRFVCRGLSVCQHLLDYYLVQTP